MTTSLTDHLKIISNHMRSSFTRASSWSVSLSPEFPAAKRVWHEAGISNVWITKWATDIEFSFTQNFDWFPGNCTLWFSSCSCSAWVPFAWLHRGCLNYLAICSPIKSESQNPLPAYFYLLRQNDFSLSPSFFITPNPKLNYLVV